MFVIFTTAFKTDNSAGNQKHGLQTTLIMNHTNGFAAIQMMSISEKTLNYLLHTLQQHGYVVKVQVRGRVHPGQVASPSQVHTETNKTNNQP